MAYQKILNLLDKAPNQPTKFRTKNWVEVNDDAHRPYNTNNQTNLKLQYKSQVYVIIVMHIYLLKELYQSQHKQGIIQIMEIKNWYLKIVLHLLIA